MASLPRKPEFPDAFAFAPRRRFDAPLAERCADLLAALIGCVDGVGCQPGYVSTPALRRAEAAIERAGGRPKKEIAA